MPRIRVKPDQRLLPGQGIWQDRKTTAKREAEAESAAVDAKTAKLRALRLAKEAADRETP